MPVFNAAYPYIVLVFGLVAAAMALGCGIAIGVRILWDSRYRSPAPTAPPLVVYLAGAAASIIVGLVLAIAILWLTKNASAVC